MSLNRYVDAKLVEYPHVALIVGIIFTLVAYHSSEQRSCICRLAWSRVICATLVHDWTRLALCPSVVFFIIEAGSILNLSRDVHVGLSRSLSPFSTRPAIPSARNPRSTDVPPLSARVELGPCRKIPETHKLEHAHTAAMR